MAYAEYYLITEMKSDLLKKDITFLQTVGALESTYGDALSRFQKQNQWKAALIADQLFIVSKYSIDIENDGKKKISDLKSAQRVASQSIEGRHLLGLMGYDDMKISRLETLMKGGSSAPKLVASKFSAPLPKHPPQAATAATPAPQPQPIPQTTRFFLPPSRVNIPAPIPAAPAPTGNMDAPSQPIKVIHNIHPIPVPILNSALPIHSTEESNLPAPPAGIKHRAAAVTPISAAQAIINTNAITAQRAKNRIGRAIALGLLGSLLFATITALPVFIPCLILLNLGVISALACQMSVIIATVLGGVIGGTIMGIRIYLDEKKSRQAAATRPVTTVPAANTSILNSVPQPTTAATNGVSFSAVSTPPRTVVRAHQAASLSAMSVFDSDDDFDIKNLVHPPTIHSDTDSDDADDSHEMNSAHGISTM